MSHIFVVVANILVQLEAAKSGIVPGSVTQNIVSGIQNVPSDIIQQSFNGGASTNAYTTFPLSPIRGNCALDKTYLNLEFDINTISTLQDFLIPRIIKFLCMLVSEILLVFSINFKS